MNDHVKLSLGAIAAVVCDVFGVEKERLRGPLRLRRFVRARQAFMLLASREGYSLPRIGHYLCDRDHTTVLHGFRRAEQLILDDWDYRRLFSHATWQLHLKRKAA